MAQVSILRSRIDDASLPSICVVCGERAAFRRFPSVNSPSLVGQLASIIPLLSFWFYIVVSKSVISTKTPGIPFCERHCSYWPRRAWFIVIGFIGLFAQFALAILFMPANRNANAQPNWLFGLAGCWMLIYLPAFLVLHLNAMRPIGGDGTHLVLSGASATFAAAVERIDDPAHE